MRRRVSAKSLRKALRTPIEEDPEFQIAPMIDVLLVLLVFFMSISTTEIIQTVKGIELAIAKDAPQPKKVTGQVIVNVRWLEGDRGELVVADNTYQNVNEITGLLQKEYEMNPEVRILVRADRKATYEYLRNLMVAVANAQIPNITFSVVDKEAADAG